MEAVAAGPWGFDRAAQAMAAARERHPSKSLSLPALAMPALYSAARWGKTPGMSKLRVGLALSAFVLLFGCEEKKSAAPVSSAETPAGAAVDPNLAQAVAAASVGAPGQPVPKAEDGPPEMGVFAPGKADELHKKGTPPKIAVGSNGSAPRQSLSLDLKVGTKLTGNVVLSMRAARQMLPPIGFDLAMDVLKPKEGESATKVVAKVTAAQVGEIQGQAIPPELQAQVGKLKGSKIELQVLPSGAISDARYELPKGGDPNLNTVLRNLAETLGVSGVVYPSEPVGAGAFWLVTSRDFAAGADVISYRMIKLDAISEAGLTLSMSTKRYSATDKLTLAGLPPGDLKLEQFQSDASGKATLQSGALFPAEGDQNQNLNAVLVPSDNPQQRMAVQSQSSATLKFPKP